MGQPIKPIYVKYPNTGFVVGTLAAVGSAIGCWVLGGPFAGIPATIGAIKAIDKLGDVCSVTAESEREKMSEQAWQERIDSLPRRYASTPLKALSSLDE